MLSTFLLTACGTVRDWRELRTDPMPLGACYDGLEFVATRSGFTADASVSDRGLGVWQSRWRARVLDDKHPGRYRLRAEVLVDEGDAATGWTVRYVIDQQRVEDLRRFADPREQDWDDHGQDREKEAILGEALVMRLAPKSRASAGSRTAP